MQELLFKAQQKLINDGWSVILAFITAKDWQLTSYRADDYENDDMQLQVVSSCDKYVESTLNILAEKGRV